MESTERTRTSYTGIASMLIACAVAILYMAYGLGAVVAVPLIAAATFLGGIALWFGGAGREYGLVGIVVSAITILLIWTGLRF